MAKLLRRRLENVKWKKRTAIRTNADRRLISKERAVQSSGLAAAAQETEARQTHQAKRRRLGHDGGRDRHVRARTIDTGGRVLARRGSIFKPESSLDDVGRTAATDEVHVRAGAGVAHGEGNRTDL